MLNRTVVLSLNLNYTGVEVIYLEQKPSGKDYVVAKKVDGVWIIRDAQDQAVAGLLTTKLMTLVNENFTDKDEVYFELEEVDYE